MSYALTKDQKQMIVSAEVFSCNCKPPQSLAIPSGKQLGK